METFRHDCRSAKDGYAYVTGLDWKGASEKFDAMGLDGRSCGAVLTEVNVAIAVS